jgi:hypothetical protein
MKTEVKIIENTALPPQKITPLPPGASNIFEAGMITQKNEAALQQSLVGGIRRRKKMLKSRRFKGGAIPVIVAPSAPSFDTNPELTNQLFGGLSELAMKTQNDAAFDKTVSGTEIDVAKISAAQQAPFKGGRKRKTSNKKGGSFWGCLSGGKKSRKYTKNRKCKKRKYKKTRKLVKRRHY